MELLAGTFYDPGTAVAKATSSRIAITAFDTTNLRLAFTTPANVTTVLVRMRTNLSGATTMPQVLLGVLDGATVKGRQVALGALPGTAIATTNVSLFAEFLVTGLTGATAYTWDAAYGVETEVASTNIHYGGPNNTTANDAWGGFAFEVWNPLPNPTNFKLLSIDSNGRIDVIKVAGTTQTAGDIIGDTNDIQSRLPAALTADGNIKADTLRVGGTLQTAGDIIGDTNDIQARLPAALGANGNIKADVRDYNGTAGTFASGRPEVNTTHWKGTIAATEDTAGYPKVTIKDGTGAGEIDTSSGRVQVTEAQIDQIVDEVWDEDATGHQTQGTFGQAIGDPVADTNTIYKAVVTDATGATVGVDIVAVKAETASIQSDTNDIQTRLPAALSGDGFIKADIKSIEDELTSGNNATLSLKNLNILNNAGDAVNIESGGAGSIGISVIGDDTGLYVTANNGTPIYAAAGIGSNANAFSLVGDGAGKSINAPDDITVSDGNLTLAAIAAAVWVNATRTLTSFGTLAADVWSVATRVLTAGTNIVLAKGVGVTGFNDLSAAQVNSEVDTALADYDAPTFAELVSEINSVQSDIAALPTVAQIVTGLQDETNGIETGLTQRQAMRLIASALAGKLSGAGTVTVTIRNAVTDSKNRITATVDNDGNRTAVSYDLS